MIEINHLSKSYGTLQVLNNINLVFDKGRTYGIVGENGSGKTTLFKCISGLESYSGNISSHFSALKNHLGFLQTDPYFFPKMTGLEYLYLLSNARSVQLNNINNKNIFDLPLMQYANNYSTGMKKKLALTALLAQNNDCYILDEPFNGVDIHSNIIITEIIHRLRSLNKTVIISSHIFSTLQDTCDEIYLLKDGSIVKKVLPEEFKVLEQEMKDFTIGSRIDRLDLK